VYPSTAELYYGQQAPFSESMDVSPKTPYACSKLMAEEYCMKLAKEKRSPITVLRPFIVYGPRQGYIMFIPQLIKACIEKKDFKMTSGQQTRDFLYVSDAVDAFIKAATSDYSIGEVINISSGIETRLRDIALKVNSLMGNPIEILFGATPYRSEEIWNYYADISKAKRLLGWAPKVSLEKGLKETIAWYRSNER